MNRKIKTKIILADDYPVVRLGARVILELDPAIAVVAEAGTLDELFTALAEHNCDILVLCLRMTGTRLNSGVAAIAAVRRAFPKVKLIVYPDSSSAQTVRIAISLGALGIVSKDEATMHLTSAIHAVSQGMRYVSSGIHRIAIGRHEVRRLSLDEELLLQLIADGNSLEEVAHIVEISLESARNRKRMAMLKLGIESIEELYRFLSTWRFDQCDSAPAL